MYRYQRGAPAHHNNPNSGSGHNSTSRVPYRPPSNYYTPYRPDPGPYRAGSSGHRPIHTPRLPYRPASTRSATRHGSYSTATGYSFTRPVTTTGKQATPQPPPHATPGSSSTSSNLARRCPPGTAGTSQSAGRNAQPGRKSCEICSFAQKPPAVKEKVFHEHFSSKALREVLGVEYALSGSYPCPSCKCHHSPYPTERTKVLLSDSTLHKFFLPPLPHQHYL